MHKNEMIADKLVLLKTIDSVNDPLYILETVLWHFLVILTYFSVKERYPGG